MCWSASVSLNTYALGLFASSLSYFNGITDIGGFIFYQSIILVQLIEYFIWSKTFSNRLLSQLLLIVILSQPIFNIIRIRTQPQLIPYLLLAYIVFIVILFIIPFNTIDFSTVPSKNGHLAWNWLNINIYAIIVWHFFLSLYWIIDGNYVLFAIVSAFLVASIILYKETNTWGSMWCWVCNIISFYIILRVFYRDLCKI